MAGSKNIFQKFSGLPWTAAMYTIGIAFLFASVGSTAIAWLFFPTEEKTPAVRASQPAVAFNVPNQRTSFNDKQLTAFLDRELFQKEEEADPDGEEQEEPDVAEEDDAVRSNLQVKLVGTIYGGDPYTGIALVENSNKNSINSFMVGDVLIDGAKVVEVLRERIIVMNNDRREYIDVSKTKLVRKRQRKRATPSKPKSPGIKPLATQPPPSTFKEPGFERKGNDMSMSQDYREKMLTTDFTKVLQDAKASPNMVDGELRGFKLTRIRQDSIYEKAGLQNE